MTDTVTPTILIVDDDHDIAELLEEGVSLMGNYHLVKANTGAQALEMIRENPPDLVLLDIMMKDMDGTQVCRAVKSDERTARVPIVAVTVIHKDETSLYEDIMDSGVDGYIEKPFSFKDVEAVVKKFLG